MLQQTEMYVSHFIACQSLECFTLFLPSGGLIYKIVLKLWLNKIIIHTSMQQLSVSEGKDQGATEGDISWKRKHTSFEVQEKEIYEDKSHKDIFHKFCQKMNEKTDKRLTWTTFMFNFFKSVTLVSRKSFSMILWNITSTTKKQSHEFQAMRKKWIYTQDLAKILQTAAIHLYSFTNVYTHYS